MNLLTELKNNIKSIYYITLNDDKGYTERGKTKSGILCTNDDEMLVCIHETDLEIFRNSYINSNDQNRLASNVGGRYFTIAYTQDYKNFTYLDANKKKQIYKFYLIDDKYNVIYDNIYVKYGLNHQLLLIYEGNASRTICGTNELETVQLNNNIISKNHTNEIYPHLVTLTDSEMQVRELIGNYDDIIFFLSAYVVYKLDGIKLIIHDTLYIQLLDYIGEYNDKLIKILSTSDILNKTTLIQPPIYVNEYGEIIEGHIYDD